MTLFKILLVLMPTTIFASEISVFPTGFKATKAYLCNGKTPKYSPTYKVKFIMPKVSAGRDLEQAAEFKASMYKAAKEYVKESFLYDLAQKPDNDMGDVTAFVDGKDKKSVEKQYSEMYYPGWVRKGGDSKLFYSIVFPEDRMALLVLRAFDFTVKDSYNHTDIAELGFYQVNRSPKINFGALKTASAFTINSEKHLEPAYYGDLKALIQTFKTKGMDWQDYLEKNTAIQENLRDDGNVFYLLKLDMEPFCTMAMAINDTVTH